MPSPVVLSHGPATISAFPRNWLAMEAIPPVCLSALTWFVTDASLPFWTTDTAQGHCSSLSHVSLAVSLVNRRLQPYVLPSQKACFLVVFRHCTPIVSLYFTRHPAACSCNPDSANACHIPVPVPSVSKEMCPAMQLLNWQGRLLSSLGFKFSPQGMKLNLCCVMHHGILLPLVAEVLGILKK